MEVCMKRVALAVVLASSAVVPATNAVAAELIYTASLSGPAESPPNASPGTGSTIVTYDDVAHTLRVQVTFSGLIANTTASHIHVLVPPALTGGVATQVPSFTGFPIGVTSGSMDNTFDLLSSTSWNPTFLNAN